MAIDSIEEPQDARRSSPLWDVVQRLLGHKLFLIGIVLVSIPLLMAILAPLIAGADPYRFNVRERFRPPGADFIFGTDNVGRSLWSRVVWGAQLSMFIGFSVVAINAVFGTLVGAIAGYYNRLDDPLMRICDALMAFPAALLAISVTAMLGPSIANVIIALGLVYTPRTARIMRGAVLSLRNMEYVQAAVAAGATQRRILFRHILPNAMAPLFVQLSFLFAYAILIEATMSFLGVGATPPTPTWGNIMAEGRQYLIDAPWIIAIPGIALMVTVLGLNMMGDGLRDVLDPRMKVQH